MKGERIINNNINDDVKQSDDVVEVIDGPPATSTSHTSESSCKSASATSTILDGAATSRKSSGYMVVRSSKLITLRPLVTIQAIFLII